MTPSFLVCSRRRHRRLRRRRLHRRRSLLLGGPGPPPAVAWDVRRVRQDVCYRGSKGRTKNSRALRARIARSLSASLPLWRLRLRGPSSRDRCRFRTALDTCTRQYREYVYREVWRFSNGRRENDFRMFSFREYRNIINVFWFLFLPGSMMCFLGDY